MTVATQFVRFFAGPSVWLDRPACEFALNQTGHDVTPAPAIDALYVAISRFLGEQPENKKVAPLPTLPPSTIDTLADAVGRLAIDLQRSVGHASQQFITHPQPDRSTHTLIVECRDQLTCVLAVEVASTLLQSLLAGHALSGEPPEAWRRLSAVAPRRLPDLPAAAIIDAARHRGIPVQNQSLDHQTWDLGNGAYRRRILGSIPTTTSSLADHISRDKALTNHYLRHAGLPVPDGRMVGTVSQAINAATTIGFPVVVKPVDRGGSIAVFVDLHAADEVAEAFAHAVAASPTRRVLVERHIAGKRYRTAVIDRKLHSVIEHLPASVIGDGRQSIRQLIDIANADPRRGSRLSDALTPISIDDDLLQQLETQRLSLDDIPPSGHRVVLKTRARRGEGGYSIDRTDDVHPDNAAVLVQVCQTLGLDVATLDLIAPDIAESIWTAGGAIVDVNIGAGFNSELNPAEGQRRDPGPAVVDMLFPPGRPVRAPIVAVLGEGAGPLCEQIASALASTGTSVGLATEAKLMVGGMELRGVIRPGAAGIRTILDNPAVELAVTEVTAASIVAEGLGFGYCDVGVVGSLSGIQRPDERPVETVLTDLLDGPAAIVLEHSIASSALLIDNSSINGAMVLDQSTEHWFDDLMTIIRNRLQVSA